MSALTLTVLPHRLAICRLAPEAAIPQQIFRSELWSLTRTADELSLVVSESFLPPDAGCQVEAGWRAIKVSGPLDFALTGILAALATPLAEAGISIFALSTYDTDYLLVKQPTLDEALTVLRAAGHQVNLSQT